MSSATLASNEVSVLLTSHRRPHTLPVQLDAVLKQTVKPKEIVIFHNQDETGKTEPDWGILRKYPSVVCSKNTGVWTRLSVALEFTTRFVCIFDDDCIPGTRWLENCFSCIKDKIPTLMGTNGVIFTRGTREPRQYVGWGSHNAEPTPVDIVGHCWFMPRLLLQHVAYFPKPPFLDNPYCGEDYYLAYLNQQMHRTCLVPPHPENDKSFWGSTMGHLGTDDVALYKRPDSEANKQRVHDGLRAIGWKTLCEK